MNTKELHGTQASQGDVEAIIMNSGGETCLQIMSFVEKYAYNGGILMGRLLSKNNGLKLKQNSESPNTCMPFSYRNDVEWSLSITHHCPETCSCNVARAQSKVIHFNTYYVSDLNLKNIYI